MPEAQRTPLPGKQLAHTHCFNIGVIAEYITLTVVTYPNDKPGSVFITINKNGSIVNGLLAYFSEAVTLLLQYGVPLSVLASEFKRVQLGPRCSTSENPALPVVKPIIDYVFQWLETRFGDTSESDGDPAA
ncbi:MAG: hypothetical protein WCW66_06175 [Patescibacteria group bacterium]